MKGKNADKTLKKKVRYGVNDISGAAKGGILAYFRKNYIFIAGFIISVMALILAISLGVFGMQKIKAFDEVIESTVGGNGNAESDMGLMQSQYNNFINSIAVYLTVFSVFMAFISIAVPLAGYFLSKDWIKERLDDANGRLVEMENTISQYWEQTQEIIVGNYGYVDMKNATEKGKANAQYINAYLNLNNGNNYVNAVNNMHSALEIFPSNYKYISVLRKLCKRGGNFQIDFFQYLNKAIDNASDKETSAKLYIEGIKAYLYCAENIGRDNQSRQKYIDKAKEFLQKDDLIQDYFLPVYYCLKGDILCSSAYLLGHEKPTAIEEYRQAMDIYNDVINSCFNIVDKKEYGALMDKSGLYYRCAKGYKKYAIVIEDTKEKKRCLKEAERALYFAINLHPNSGKYYSELASVQLEIYLLEKDKFHLTICEETLKSGLRVDPSNAILLGQYGEFLYHMGEFEQSNVYLGHARRMLGVVYDRKSNVNRTCICGFIHSYYGVTLYKAHYKDGKEPNEKRAVLKEIIESLDESIECDSMNKNNFLRYKDLLSECIDDIEEPLFNEKLNVLEKIAEKLSGIFKDIDKETIARLREKRHSGING